MAWCLTGQLADQFLQKLRSGEIVPEKLTDMTSAERHTYFSNFLGEENALRTNALFESKLLLKNQQRGIINWAKQTIGMKPEIQRDVLSRVNKMTEILQPQEADAFLNDLVNQKLGASVSLEEAGRIADLAKAVSGKKSLMKEDFTFGSETERLNYGRSHVVFANYVNDLKMRAGRLTLKEYAKRPIRAVTEISGVAKAVKASMDNSAIFRQGWKALFTHPGIWAGNAQQSFVNIWKSFGKDVVMDELNADILSRPNSLNGTYKKMGLDVGTIEESYPTHLPAKVPVLGKAYKASENAFTAFVHKTRVDIGDKYIDIAQKSGVDITDKVELQSIGRMVNSLTGRGSLGRLESMAGTVNNVFFSPRLMKANLDFLFAHIGDRIVGIKVTPFVQKQAIYNLLKVVGGTAAILTIADAVKPGSVEWDSRSADFGKIRIGNTRFDVTGGMGSFAVLASRLITNASKSSVTGRVQELGGKKYMATTRMDVIYNFFENKFSPATSVIKDLLKGRTYQGGKPTIPGEISNLFEPLISTTGRELLQNEERANIIAALIADALGISTNTYKSRPKRD